MKEKKKKISSLGNSLYYFWENNRLLIIAVGVIAALGIYFLITNLREKETVLSVFLMDCHTDLPQEQMEEDFLKAMELNPRTCRAEIITNLMLNSAGSSDYAMVSLSRLLSDIGSEKLDVCGRLDTDFKTYNDTDAFMDLRDCLTPEQIGDFSGEMFVDADGVPRGISAGALPVLAEYGCYTETEEKVWLGVIYNTRRKENAADYLLYLAGLS